MNPMLRISLALTCLAIFSGCAHRQPLISHAHVGHCLTQWHDTPRNEGLFTVARQEIETARDEADAALVLQSDPTQKAAHLGNAAHALDPDLQPFGPGLDYGAIRALEGALEHLEYAATSDDASPNIVTSVATLAETGGAIVQRLRDAAAQARPADARDVAALDRRAVEMRATLNAASTELEQMRTQLDAMLARERDPAYEPLSRKYLLGLVRLPNGKWVFASLRKALSKPTYGYD